jgi:hypothetical protein
MIDNIEICEYPTVSSSIGLIYFLSKRMVFNRFNTLYDD